MTVFEAIQHRRSIRAFTDKPVEEAVLKRVLEAGRLAPSAKNQQRWKFIAVTDPAIQRQMTAACFNQTFVGDAPASIVVCAGEDYVMKCGISARIVDASIALSFIMLAAEELGLSTCWIGSFDPEKVRDLLQIPADHQIIALTPIGYPAMKGRDRTWKSFDEVASFNKF